MEFRIPLQQRYKDMPKNLDFILNDKFRSALFGGYGNGKTESLCWRAILLALTKPNALGLIGRETYPELRDSTIRSFFDVCPPEIIADHKKQENMVILKNGAQILFRAFDDPRKILSMNLGWIGIDQLEEISEEMYLQMLGRLRDPECRYFFGVGNPEMNWVKKTFKDLAGRDKDLFFVEATTQENPHLPSDYVKNLINNFPDHWVKRFVWGSWEHFEGSVFTEFLQQTCVVDPFEIPKTWRVEYVIDYGYRNPFACIKIAIDYDGNYFVIAEHYEREKILSYHAEKIKEMGYTRDNMCWIDPSCSAKNRTKNELQVSIIDELADEGILCIPANNNIAGVLRTNQAFKSGRLKIFRNCENTIKEISGLRWKKVKPNWDKNMPEEMEDKENHICLVGDTLITMGDSKQKKIKNIQIGEYVISETGVRKVIDSRETSSSADIWRVYLANGEKIDGTAKHKIFTQSGDKSLDSLKYKDVLSSICKNIYYSKDRNTDGMEDIFLPLADVRMAASGYMSQSGKVSMELFLLDFMSIIKILTEKIMQLKILKQLKRLNICDCICKGIFKTRNIESKKWNCLIESVRLRLYGTSQKLAGNGIDNMLKKHGNIKQKLKKIANFVGVSMKHISLLILSFVIPIVTKLLKDQSVWVIGVRRLNIKAPVYNLTIDTDHNYYANGILVANCDCLKYFMNSRAEASIEPKPKHYPMLEREKELQRLKKTDWYSD